MSPSDGVAARCEGLVKVYRAASGEVHALRGLEATFPAGSVTAVVGPSGSGKSSLLRILATLDPPTAGSVSVAGQELAGLSPAGLRRVRREHVGYVFQRPSHNLIPHLSARQHLVHAARLRRTGIDPDDLLEALGIGGRAAHRPSELSGGEQQRLAFAQAVVGGPALVLADEPTAELDSASGATLLRAMATLAQRHTAVVVATHDPQVVRAADRTLTLRHGTLLSETTAGVSLAVVDAGGRLQLPPETLRWFPQARARVVIGDREIRITPP